MTDVGVRPVTPDSAVARGRWGRTLRTLGILFLLGAFAIGGYLAWTLWGTGLTTNRWQSDLRPDLERRIRAARAEPVAPPGGFVHLRGGAVAIIRIPRIDLDMVVVEGTDTESLKKGPGHYEGSAYPWDDNGKVAIAGHRTTYGAPFYSLDELRPGDRIELATEFGSFRYEVTKIEITPPTGILASGRSVLDQTRRPTLVLTTCNPRYSAAQRLIVFADRVDPV